MEGTKLLILLSILKVLNRRDWTEQRDKQIVSNSLPSRSAERWVLVARFDFTTYPNSLTCKFLGLGWPLAAAGGEDTAGLPFRPYFWLDMAHPRSTGMPGERRQCRRLGSHRALGALTQAGDSVLACN